MDDEINQPPHYTATKIEPIDVIEAWGLNFCLGNVVKYIARLGRKDEELQELKKARWYLDREIKRRELDRHNPPIPESLGQSQHGGPISSDK
jgi:hypothetical protein